MANLSTARSDKRRKLTEALNFRPLSNQKEILNAPDAHKEALEEQGYYLGYECMLGHRIRDAKYHWCYQCVLRIQSNICGVDVTHIHSNYRWEVRDLWYKVGIKNTNECWPINMKQRVSLPSYQTFYAKKRTNNVTISKAIYTSCWGDIGKMRVGHSCGNSECGNPLHLISSWNRRPPPREMHYFFPEVNIAEAFELAERRKNGEKIDLENFIRKKYKNTITNPADVPILE